MQQRFNFALFIVLSALILGGWFWLFNQQEPSKEIVQAEKNDQKEKKKDPDKGAKEEKKVKEEPVKEKEKDKKEPEPKKIEAPQRPAAIATLGGEGFHLTVETTERGAGVRKVTLNRFKEADSYGRPTGRNLEIIQEDDYAPSFRMYPYLKPNDDAPVLGLGESLWNLDGRSAAGAEVHEVRYSATIPGLDHIKIAKTYRLAPKDYHVTLILEFVNKETNVALPATSFRYQLTGAQGMPIEGEWYTATFRTSMIGLVDPSNSLWRSQDESVRIAQRRFGDAVPENRDHTENRLQYAGVATQYFAVMIVVDNEQPTKAERGVSPEKILAWARPTLESTETKGIITRLPTEKEPNLLRFMDDKKVDATYVLLPRTQKHLADLSLKAGDRVVVSSYETPDGRRIASWIRAGETLRPQFDDITVRVNSKVISLLPGQNVKHQFMLYHGPVKVALLSQFGGEEEVSGTLVDRYADDLHLRTLTDYHFDNWFGRMSSRIGLTWLIIKFTSLMHWLLYLLQWLLGWIPGSYGLSIIALTVMVRAAMFPITRKQTIFSIKMQELAPEFKKIQERYPDDSMAQFQARNDLMRRHGISQFGTCWSIFLQMPIFLGLYYALQESIHFRLGEFLWIKSLAAPDMLLFWSENIPIISSPDYASGFLGALYLGPYLNILPGIAVIFMMIQQGQTMPPPTDEQQEVQQKMLKYMTVIFAIMFYKVAAGLCIYFIAGSVWGMAERLLLPKQTEDPANPGGTTPPDGATIPQGPTPPKGKGKWDKKDKNKDKDQPPSTFDKLKALWQEILRQAEKK
ncbi:MAG: membrane protein insertase YidC [Planctomycetes bacterium]|nr:membrane protein insertase YidC [Planctomycetota bacterium]